MMNRLFVSRYLEDDSPIKVYCEEQGLILEAQSLLNFTTIPIRTLPNGNWLFFYSKSGVNHFSKQIVDKSSIASYQIACFGPSTASVWEERFGEKADFIGDGKPEHVPNEFKQVLDQNDTIVFIRAKHSKMSVQRSIESEFNCLDVIAYENSMRTDSIQLATPDIAMLTSPLNADAFLDAVPRFTGRIITLGSTTSTHLKKHYNMASVVSEIITEQGMLDKLVQMLDEK
jgi:uroporphyrinogen-III synthase